MGDTNEGRNRTASEGSGSAAPPRANGDGADDGAAQNGPQRGQGVGARAALAVFVALLTAALFVHLRWVFSKPLPGLVSDANGWISALSGKSLPSLMLVVGPSAGLLALTVGLLVHFGFPQVWPSARRSLQLGAVLGGCLAAAWFIGTTRLDGLKKADWLFFVPIVPPALLAFQALNTWRQRPRSVGDFRIGVSCELRKALELSGDVDRFKEVHQQLVRVFGGVTAADASVSLQPGTKLRQTTHRGTYNPASIATQFAVPGLLLLLVGFGAMALATNPEVFDKVAAHTPRLGLARIGLKWGVAGAFTYVLFTFGSRSFRNDLTVGAATWAIITLITGPALAVVLALVWSPIPTPNEHDLIPWQSAVVLFFAGLAPRRVMDVIENIAMRFLKPPTEATISNLVPLTKLRSISAELAVRLREENIEDVIGLAYADPIRLVQAVPYDLRQVVEWIDQAQLAAILPEQHPELAKRGVTGAIDLAWRWLQACQDPDTQKFTIAPAKEVPKSFKALVGDEHAELVYAAAQQMFYEEQVRLLWVMYNCFSTTAGDVSPNPPADSNVAPRTDSGPHATNGAPEVANGVSHGTNGTSNGANGTNPVSPPRSAQPPNGTG